jgi:hypothetical protein
MNRGPPRYSRAHQEVHNGKEARGPLARCRRTEGKGATSESYRCDTSQPGAHAPNPLCRRVPRSSGSSAAWEPEPFMIRPSRVSAGRTRGVRSVGAQSRRVTPGRLPAQRRHGRRRARRRWAERSPGGGIVNGSGAGPSRPMVPSSHRQGRAASHGRRRTPGRGSHERSKPGRRGPRSIRHASTPSCRRAPRRLVRPRVDGFPCPPRPPRDVRRNPSTDVAARA